ncbi:MAG TPA: GH116 family glycosyl-hydrolase, partial [Chloroflexia bacterium]|nr:GH116 family glycosyl-hydrolase [Chloroflexia bacterium]
MTRRGLRAGPLVAGALLIGALLAAGWLTLRPRPPANVPASPPTIQAQQPGAPSPEGTHPVSDATTTAVPPLAGVPAAAWRRDIGAPLDQPGVNKIHLPNNADDGYWQGAPIGGMGSGSIGRTYRGDFARWHLAPGENIYATTWADQFSVRVARPGAEPTARVLMPGRPPRTLGAWNWDYPAGGGTYAALFPFAWYGYDAAAAGVTLQTRQFSPVIPRNYRESSYPVALFEWTVTNDAATPADVSLLFTWENPLGWDDHTSGVAGNTNRVRRDTLDGAPMVGVVMGRGGPDGSPGPAAVTQPWDGEFV